MRILEHFDTVIALDDGTGDVQALCARLVVTHCAPVVVDLAAPEGWRARLTPLLRSSRPLFAWPTLLRPQSLPQ